MDIILNILSLLIAVVGVIGAVVPVLPGAILSFVALLLCYFSECSIITTTELLIWLGLSIAVSVIDSILPIYLTKRLGGSKSGVWGATIGMIIGFIAFPPFGVFIGPIFGAIMGELLNDKENINRALKVGMASFLAFIVGTGIKFALSIYILAIILANQVALIEQIKAWQIWQ